MAALSEARDYERAIRKQPRRWLVTGSAGFIGSHLLETLLRLGQSVSSLDNFATGHRRNLEDVRSAVGNQAWLRHTFIEGDITDPATCTRACAEMDVILHQAALGSVPRSIARPLATHAANATGFLNILDAARLAGVKRFVYASSSSTYGDDTTTPKVETVIGKPLSPYAVTKFLNELYANLFGRCYGMETVGLRYFNVFGARQDPVGPYAAVIPRWTGEMLAGRPCMINGDGETSRDFCYIANVIQANLRAAVSEDPAVPNQVFNVAFGETTTLNTLHGALADVLKRKRPELVVAPALHGEFRAGDIRQSLADIGKARQLLGYAPTHDLRGGLIEAIGWYVDAIPPEIAGAAPSV